MADDMTAFREEEQTEDFECDICGDKHETECCPELNVDELQHVLKASQLTRARLTLPYFLRVVDENGTIKVLSKETLPARTKFGPFEAPRSTTELEHSDDFFLLKVTLKDGFCVYLDTSDENTCNWLCLVRTAFTQANCMAVQLAMDIYYLTLRDITAGEELVVWYAPHYAMKLGRSPRPDGTPAMLHYKLEQTLEAISSSFLPPAEEDTLPDEHEAMEMPSSQPDDLELNEETPPEDTPHPETTEALDALTSPRNLHIRHHGGPDGYTCSRCDNLPFDSLKELALHIKEHVRKEMDIRRRPGRPRKDPALKAKRPGRPRKSPADQGQETISTSGAGDVEDVSSTAGAGDSQVAPSTTATDYEEVKNESESHIPLKEGTLHGGNDEEGQATTLLVIDFNEGNDSSVAQHARTLVGEGKDQGKGSGLRKEKAIEDDRSRTGSVLMEALSDTKMKPATQRSPGSRYSGGSAIEYTPRYNRSTPKTSHQDKNFQYSMELTERVPNIPKGTVIRTRRQANREQEMRIGHRVPVVLLVDISKEPPGKTSKKRNKSKITSVTAAEAVEPKDSAGQFTKESRDKKRPGRKRKAGTASYHPSSPSSLASQAKIPKVDSNEEQTAVQEEDEMLEDTASFKQKNAHKTWLSLQEALTASPEQSMTAFPEQSLTVPPEQSLTVPTEQSLTASPEQSLTVPPEQSLRTLPEDDFRACPEEVLAALPGEGSNEMVCAVKEEDGTLLSESVGVDDSAGYHSLSIVPPPIANSLEEVTGEQDLSAPLQDDGSLHTSPLEQLLPQTAGQTQEGQEEPDCSDMTEDIKDSTDLMINSDNQSTLDTSHADIFVIDDNKIITIASTSKLPSQQPDYEEEPADDKSGISVLNMLSEGHAYAVPMTAGQEPIDSGQQSTTLQALQCLHCEEVFQEGEKDKYEEHLKTHVTQLSNIGATHQTNNSKKKKTSSDTLFSCEECGKTFETELYLKRHMSGHELPFQCEKCSKRFARKGSIKNHKCKDKASKDLWRCEFCGQGFKDKKYLYRHMATHTGEYTCPRCSRDFSRKESLYLHLTICDPDTLSKSGVYPCKLCKKVFMRELSLQNHMALHTEEFRCHVCRKCFSSKLSMESHKCMGEVADVDASSGTLFECSDCSKVFTTEHYLRRHRHVHTGDYSCRLCHRQFSRKDELVKHTLLCTANSQVQVQGRITCPICKEFFPDPNAFRDHYEVHTHPYKCGLCHRSFLRQPGLDNHICEPQGEGHVPCSMCSRQFGNQESLQRHQLVHGDPKFQCNKCKRKFVLQEHVDAHECPERPDKPKKKYWGKEEAVICSVCGKSYSNAGNLKKHMITHGEKLEECPICHKRFHLKVFLKEHMVVHNDQRPYHCHHCGRNYKNRNALNSHKRHYHAATLVLYECEECGRQFRQKGNLKKHMLRHTDEKLYNCTQCERVFKYPEQLRRHTLWHDESRRHQCTLCDRKFVMKFELNNHMDTHRGTVFICDICNTECSKAGTMRRHLGRRHPDVLAWQADPPTYIRGLMYQTNPDLATNGSQVVTSIGEEKLGSLLKQDSEHPLIVAEVSGIEEGTTQTIVIQRGPDDTQATETIVTQEVAKALRTWQEQQNAESGFSNITIVGDSAGDGDEVPVMVSTDHTHEHGYYIVPIEQPNAKELMEISKHSSSDSQASTYQQAHLYIDQSTYQTIEETAEQPLIQLQSASEIPISQVQSAGHEGQDLMAVPLSTQYATANTQAVDHMGEFHMEGQPTYVTYAIEVPEDTELTEEDVVESAYEVTTVDPQDMVPANVASEQTVAMETVVYTH